MDTSEDAEEMPHSFSLRRTVIEKDLQDFQTIIENPLTRILDLRALDFWNKSLDTPTPRSRSSSNRSVDLLTQEVLMNRILFLAHLEPPNEFDWFAWDRLGRIVSSERASEIFGLLRDSKNSGNMTEVLLNGRRDLNMNFPLNNMPEALSQMKSLTKLVLRGLADNFVLKAIGRNIFGLKHLDISFSQLVTDDGILKLLFKEDMSAKSALVLIPTWIQKNLHNMWPLAGTLEYLNFSLTSTTAQAQKVVQLIPGCYTFKRLLTTSDVELYGHHIFMRRIPDLSIPIRYKDIEDGFEAELQKFGGKKGASAFLSFVRRHPWRSCNLALYRELKIQNGRSNSAHILPTDESKVTIGIITPSKEEKRINGVIVFKHESICQLYSANPIHLHQLAQACHGRLEILTGLVNDTHHQEGLKFTVLTKVDILAEPETFLSLLKASPNLEEVRVRILRKPLISPRFFEVLDHTCCQKTLKDLWIAPGSYKRRPFHRTASTHSTLSVNSFAGNSIVSLTDVLLNRQDVTQQLSSDLSLFHTDLSDGLPEKDARIENLVQLSIECVKKLLGQCPKLSRLGNLFLWTILETDFEILCEELQNDGSNVKLIWDHFIAPSGCKFIEGRLYPAF